jgi:hypothetical protein
MKDLTNWEIDWLLGKCAELDTAGRVRLFEAMIDADGSLPRSVRGEVGMLVQQIKKVLRDRMCLDSKGA